MQRDSVLLQKGGRTIYVCITSSHSFLITYLHSKMQVELFFYLLSISRVQHTNPAVWLSWRQLQAPTPPQPNRNSALFDRCLPVSTDAYEFRGESSFLQVVLFV